MRNMATRGVSRCLERYSSVVYMVCGRRGHLPNGAAKRWILVAKTTVEKTLLPATFYPGTDWWPYTAILVGFNMVLWNIDA